MLVLALDTSTRAGSVALAEDGRLLQAASGDPARLHAERLPVWLFDTLAAAGRTLADVDRLAVLSGPGGFTGLRVGLATIQGLAAARGLPVHVASTLEVLAWGAAQAGAEARATVAGAWMRGMRGEVFAALYDWPDASPDTDVPPSGLRPRLAPYVDTPDAAAARWRDTLQAAERVVLAGDAWDDDGDALRSAVGTDRLVWRAVGPPAALLALLALHPSAATVPPAAVVPTYVRRPDAVLTRERAGLAVSSER